MSYPLKVLVVEAHPEGEEQICFLNRVVYPRLAMHAHHSKIERMRSRESSDTEQRHRNRNRRALC